MAKNSPTDPLDWQNRILGQSRRDSLKDFVQGSQSVLREMKRLQTTYKGMTPFEELDGLSSFRQLQIP